LSKSPIFGPPLNSIVSARSAVFMTLAHAHVLATDLPLLAPEFKRAAGGWREQFRKEC
jgi:hypothetical protein